MISYRRFTFGETSFTPMHIADDLLKRKVPVNFELGNEKEITAWGGEI